MTVRKTVGEVTTRKRDLAIVFNLPAPLSVRMAYFRNSESVSNRQAAW
jgi:hypothetical protein